MPVKITYQGPNRSSNYAYAGALHHAGALHAFVSGFSRLSPRARLLDVGAKLKRHDFWQTLYVGSLKLPLLRAVSTWLNQRSGRRLDVASYKWARESDAFIFYRTQGLRTSRRLHRQGAPTLCILEEVNSHIEYAREILHREYQRLGLTRPFEEEPDHALRLQAYEEADYILCPSDFVVNSFLEKGFAPEQLIKVNFGFPPQETGAAEAKPAGVFRVLYVGQLNYRKGLHYAVEAFRQLQHPRKEFVIVGPETPVTGLEKTDIPPGVTFTGALKGEELKAQYRAASCFVLPSLEEGLALVQSEALAFGLPLLTTTNTGGADLITDGQEGFIVPPADAEALREKLQLLADDPNRLTQMAAAAARTARTFDTWDVAGQRLVAEVAARVAARAATSRLHPSPLATA